ncbi:peptidase S41 [Gemmatirosa kalamazoonensis]|uniref:Peptidase S41 n=1 Tax=Gemmatirosa kalamazoonensis TaxID=861299 RepID=W0RCP6_9BACT|nr:S41 family peptidase [Gemmatirosa kalamazoonensis]AHG88095.1 peptidase S41 [Gemmatirosa kalamazoonensis]
MHRSIRLRLLLAVAIAPAARAQAPMAAAPTVDAPTRRDVVDSIGDRLRRYYADADTGRLIAEHLERRAKAGAFDTLTNALRFADVLTRELQVVNGDRHLYVRYAPDDPGMRPGPEGIRMLARAGGGGREPSPAAIESARRAHWALGRLDVLPGNVGYMDVRGFASGPGVDDAIVNALRYLDGTDAMIIDLRRNGGGSAESVNMLLSHFTTADTVASLRVSNRSGQEAFTRYTLARVPGPRRPDVPLFVLTSGVTASAGEDFAFVAKNLGRAKLVGAVTAGAGRNNAQLDVGHGFGASISFSRVQDPRTGKEWERVGVQPDVAVDATRALDVAHAMALAAIAEREPAPPRKQLLALLREAVLAQSEPRAVSPELLASYAGTYASGRIVTLDAGRLLWSPRPGALPEPLVPLSDSTFAQGALRIAFERDAGRVARLRLTSPGDVVTFARVP